MPLLSGWFLFIFSSRPLPPLIIPSVDISVLVTHQKEKNDQHRSEKKDRREKREKREKKRKEKTNRTSRDSADLTLSNSADLTSPLSNSSSHHHHKHSNNTHAHQSQINHSTNGHISHISTLLPPMHTHTHDLLVDASEDDSVKSVSHSDESGPPSRPDSARVHVPVFPKS